MFTINRENLKKSHQSIWLVIDFMMLGLLIVNLALIIFDSIYSFEAIQDFFQQSMPAFYSVYHPIHRNFIFYDLIFVSIFLTEFFGRWLYALRARTYQRWYFYPFIHWYDLLGCVPTGGMRFLRVLRVISIVYRLHRYGIVDFTQTRLFQFLAFYYDAFLEELSDRIVLKVLSGMQEEVRRGAPVLNRIEQEILLPRRELLAGWLSGRIADLASEGYVPNRDALRRYLEDRIRDAMRQNPELSRLRLLPIFGNQVRGTLEGALGNITATILNQVMEDLANSRNHEFVADMVDAFLPEPRVFDAAGAPVVRRDNDVMIAVTLEILEVFKDQVRYKRWRERL